MNMIKKAMIMSAGMGSRLEPLTLLVPKPLVPVCNVPVMDVLFKKLVDNGISDVICNTYYLANQIIDRYKTNDLGINFNYIVEEELSGTAGGLKKCQSFFDEGEDFLVMSADGLTDIDIQKGIEIHKNSGAIATICVKRIPKDEVSHFGVVVTDSDGYITEFQEKPSVEEAKSDLINTGIYIFNYKIFDYIPQNEFYDFAKNVFPKLLKEHQINTFLTDAYWSDIGTLNQYKTSMTDVFDGSCECFCGEITHTETGRYICEKPIDAKFIGDSVIGKDCKIGKNVTIQNSIIWDNVKIANDAIIKNCIIASNEVIACNMSNKIICCGKVI